MFRLLSSVFRPLEAIMWRLGILLAVVLLVACRGNDEDVVAVEPDTRLTVRFADLQSRGSSYDRAIALFEEQNPDVRVEFVGIGVEVDWFELAELADVALLPGFPAGVAPSYFHDLSDRLEPADYWPDSVGGCAVSGHQFGLPLFLTPTTIFVREGVLEEAGVARPGLDWTWAEFAHVAEQVSGADWDGLVINEGSVYLLAPLIDAVLSANRGGELERDELLATADWYTGLVQSGAVLLGGDRTNSVMWLDGAANLSRQRAELDEPISLYPYPERTPIGAGCGAISTGTANEELAWRWLDFLADNPPARRFEVPGRVATANGNGFWDRLEPDVSAVYEQALDHAWYGHPSEAIRTVAQVLDEVGLGETGLHLSLDNLPTPEPLPTAGVVPVVVSATATPVPVLAEGSVRFFTPEFVSNMAAMREAAVAFTAQTGIPIAFGDTTDIRSHLQAPSDFSRVPREFDCYAFVGDLPPEVAEESLVISDLLGALDPAWSADFDPLLLEAAGGHEELVGLPTSALYPVLYYQADRFGRKDLAAPALDWTLEEMMGMAALMPLGEGTSQIYGFVPTRPFLGGAGGDPYALLLSGRGVMVFDFSSDLPQVNFATAETVAGVVWLVEQVAAGVVAPYDGGGTRSDSGNVNRVNEVIRTGRGTMWLGVLDENGSRFGWWGSSFLVGTATLPVAADVSLPAPAMNQLYISGRSDNAEACASWLLYLSTIPEVYSGVPARLSVRESEAWAEYAGNNAPIYLEMANRSYQPAPDPALMQPLYEGWEDALLAIFEGADIGQTLSGLQEQADVYLACVAGLDDWAEDTLSNCMP